jgi:superoxide dismutase, Fe-Mn family
MRKKMSLELPNLPYAYDALTPYMSAETLELHHDKHHLAYVNNSTAMLEKSKLRSETLENIMLGSFDDGNVGPLFNNVAQHWNHIKFWEWMKPNGGGNIPGNLEAKLTADFGSIEEFKTQFIQTGVTQFGSGWCWLILTSSGKLSVTNTPNTINPIANGSGIPILGCDVWEHSYYVDYRNARPDYIKAFVDNMVNWEKVAEILEQAL